MESQLINNLLSQVKQNKKYFSIADKIIIEEIKEYLRKNQISKISKQDIKEIRNQLHKSYASFQTKKKNKINNYLNELQSLTESKLTDVKLLHITDKLLSVTLSTKERINDYPNLYKQIFKITGIPKSIVDLGAGFNVFSYPFMNLNELTYYSYDIDINDISVINNYINIMKIRGLSGRGDILDVRNKEEISKLPSSDIVFLFKIIDIINKQNHKPSEELIKYLINNKAKFIVASFATKTFTRKQMNYPNRKWFELMLERNNLKFQTIKTDNEIFYVISQ
ncbi:MAG: hypothetical protein AABX54_02445 [Nanoarchaeota archaeon]